MMVARSSPPPDASVATLRDVAMWTSAREGRAEDLAALAVHEGAAGLVEAAAEPELRKTALQAMAFARGWAHVPFLASVAESKDDAEAKIALESLGELAARPRRSEDAEDAAELGEGCEKLGALARDAARVRGRRISAIHVLRMMPCPKLALPSDLDGLTPTAASSADSAPRP